MAFKKEFDNGKSVEALPGSMELAEPAYTNGDSAMVSWLPNTKSKKGP